MFKNYFKIAVRNLLKHKTYTSINVFGLAIAFICSILLFLNVRFEFSYDNFFKDKERIFKMYIRYHSSIKGEELRDGMCVPMAPTLKSEVPEIEASSRFMWGGHGIEYQGKYMDEEINLVDPDFFKTFSLSIVKGNKDTPLSDLASVIITESTAERLFNKEDPIGKLIKVKIDDQWKELVVGSVVKDPEKNASVTYNVLVRSELHRDYVDLKNNWDFFSHAVYIKIAENSTQNLIESKCRFMLGKYKAVDSTYMKNEHFLKDEYGNYQSLRLLPLNEFHFNQHIGVGDVISKNYVYTLLLISIFILAIACFNFINLNIARSFTRAKEVGVRKCLGGSRKQIFFQIWGESLLVCGASVLMGFLGSIFIFPFFNKLFGSKLSLDFFYQPSSILFILGMMFIISLFAGGYPALLISKLNTVSILKGTISLKKPGIFRNSLIVFQFGIACFLMACTLIAYKQFEFMRTMPLGFNKELVISVPLANEKNGRSSLNQFRNRLASNPSINSISGSNINIGIGKDGNRSKTTNSFEYNGKSISTNWMTVDYDFLKTLDIKLMRGRDFNKAFGTDVEAGVLITESVAKQMTQNKDVGVTFSTDSTIPKHIILGVIQDFHLYSLHEEIEPLTIDISNNVNIKYIFLKVATTNPLLIMSEIEKLYKELEPGKEFKGTFLNENTENFYKKEKQLSILLGISSSVAIVLSCLGLFALALLMIQQRIKEIGVRKVLGASIANLNNLLIKDFLKLVIVSIIISSPLAWWIMNKWLQDFPYRIEISYWMFIIIGFVAIIISLLTVSYHTIKAAIVNPVESLRTE